MILYSYDWTDKGFSFTLLTVNLFRHSTLIEHGLKYYLRVSLCFNVLPTTKVIWWRDSSLNVHLIPHLTDSASNRNTGKSVATPEPQSFHAEFRYMYFTIFRVVRNYHFLKKNNSICKSNIKKVSKGAKIRNRYNQVPHLTQDTNGKLTNHKRNLRSIFFYLPYMILARSFDACFW